MSDHPPVVFRTLPDGAIVVSVGDIRGTVHSEHLTWQKARQVIAAWERQSNRNDTHE